MLDTPQALASRLSEEGVRVVDFFKNLSEEQWGVRIYPQESNWNFRHLLSHFVSSEIGRKELILNVLAGGEGAPPDFEIDTFNKMEVARLSGSSNSYLLKLFTQERSNLAKLVSDMDMKDLERIGNDPYLGSAPIHEMIKLTYRHLQIHIREARQYI